MPIASGLQYDPATKSVLGSVTMPTPDKHAKKLLTCMLGSLTVHYKQVVAYHFTGTSVAGTELWEFVLSIIMACGQRGVGVVAVVRINIFFNIFNMYFCQMPQTWISF